MFDLGDFWDKSSWWFLKIWNQFTQSISNFWKCTWVIYPEFPSQLCCYYYWLCDIVPYCYKILLVISRSFRWDECLEQIIYLVAQNYIVCQCKTTVFWVDLCYYLRVQNSLLTSCQSLSRAHFHIHLRGGFSPFVAISTKWLQQIPQLN